MCTFYQGSKRHNAFYQGSKRHNAVSDVNADINADVYVQYATLHNLLLYVSQKINKLLNKLSQFPLCTKWKDEHLFYCHVIHHSTARS